MVRNNNVAARFNRKQLIRVCKGVRSEIQLFETEFQAQHGRKPNPGADRAAIVEKYDNYRALKKFVRANAACKIQATYRGHLGRIESSKIHQVKKEELARVAASKAAAMNRSDPISIPQRPGPTAEPLTPQAEKAPANREPIANTDRDVGAEGNRLSGYLAAAQRRLEEERARVGRPWDMSQMAVKELEDEKTFIKYELKKFDDILGEELGRALKKADKEPMRPLYSRYHEIKNLLATGVQQNNSANEEAAHTDTDGGILQDASNKASTATVSKFTSDAAQRLPVQQVAAQAEAKEKPQVSYQQLKQEKRTLQQKLHQYESEFFKKHGRKMKHHEDIAPVQHEYTEYKRLKGVLSSMEAEGLAN